MANTRSSKNGTSEKQTKLEVDAGSQGEGKVTAKRKQDDSKKEEQGSQVEEDDAKEQPPAKAAKQDDSEDKKNGGDENEQAAKDDKPKNGTQETKSDSKPAPPSSQAEKKAAGEDTGPVGSNQDDIKWNVLERGHIYFFYRPKVQPAPKDGKEDTSNPSVQSIDDAQNFHLLLLPRSSSSSTAPAKPESQRPSDVENKSEQTGEKAKQGGVGARMIRLGKKRMPEPKAAIERGDQPGGIGGDAAETIWSVISDVAPSFDSLKDSLASRRYTTKTAGERLVGGARPVGRGWYILTLSETEPPSSREVRLSYVLSHPHDEAGFGDVQKEFGLNKESSVRLQMRNPTLPSTGAGAPPAGLEPSERVQMSDEEIQKTFGGEADAEGTRYARPENIELLDRAGVELLMIKKQEQEKEGDLGMGETHKVALEKLAKDDAGRLSNEDVLKEVRLSSAENPPDALDGEWI